jgi:hypothetical protein
MNAAHSPRDYVGLMARVDVGLMARDYVGLRARENANS